MISRTISLGLALYMFGLTLACQFYAVYAAVISDEPITLFDALVLGIFALLTAFFFNGWLDESRTR